METVFLRTAPGLEDLIKQEVLEALGKEPPETRIKARSGRGWVEVVPPPSVVPEERFKNLRTVFRSMILKASAPRGESKPEAEALKLVQKGRVPRSAAQFTFPYNLLRPQGALGNPPHG